MRHVCHEVGAYTLRDLSHACVVPIPRIGRCAGDEHLGFEELGALFHLVVVHEARVVLYAIRQRLEVYAGGGHAALGSLISMGEVTAGREIETHDSIVGLLGAHEHINVVAQNRKWRVQSKNKRNEGNNLKRRYRES